MLWSLHPWLAATTLYNEGEGRVPELVVLMILMGEGPPISLSVRRLC